MNTKQFIKEYRERVFFPTVNTDGGLLVTEEQLEKMLNEYANFKLKEIDVSDIVTAFLKWREGMQLSDNTILEVETFVKEYINDKI